MRKLSSSIRIKFTFIFIGILCFSCTVSLGITAFIRINFMVEEHKTNDIRELILLGVAALICAAIGSVLMFFATKLISKPIEKISDITKEISKGNFCVQVDYSKEDEIGVLARNINLMVKELNNMEYLRKDFMSSVSHEFKTPISSIQGFVEIIKDKNLPPEKFEEYTDIIIEETKRLTNLSSNILKLSKLDNQVIQSKKVKFSLDEQIRKTLLILEEQWSKKNLELEINLEKIDYKGDEELTQQIWVNLIGNAIKFSNDYGSLYITLRKNFSYIIVEIEDEGVGISEESKSRVFERFYQGDGSRSGEGNGLGLAIVNRIIEISAGRIYFESEVGKGTCFTVELPK